MVACCPIEKAKSLMSCRSTPATSAAVSLAYACNQLDDAQVTSLFHALKREGEAEQVEAPTQQEYLAALDRMETQTRNMGLGEAGQERILARIEAARTQPVLDGPSFYALQSIKADADLAEEAIIELCEEVSARTSMSTSDVRDAFERFRDQADSYEDVTVPDERFRFDKAEFLPQDKDTLKAARKLGYELYLLQPHPVFVYGTLRPGQGNHHLLTQAKKSEAPAALDGVAIYGAHRGFPYAAEHDDPEAFTLGEVVWLSGDRAGRAARQNLDYLEGFDSDAPSSSHYERVLRPVTYMDADGEPQMTDAWVYLARGPYRTQLSEAERILDGDWVAAKLAYRQPRPRYEF